MTRPVVKPFDRIMQKEMTKGKFVATFGFGHIVEILTIHSIHKSNAPSLGYDKGSCGSAKTTKQNNMRIV